MGDTAASIISRFAAKRPTDPGRAAEDGGGSGVDRIAGYAEPARMGDKLWAGPGCYAHSVCGDCIGFVRQNVACLPPQAGGGVIMFKECCATCEYWAEKYQECDHPYQLACEAGPYGAPPDKVCELYERQEEDTE